MGRIMRCFALGLAVVLGSSIGNAQIITEIIDATGDGTVTLAGVPAHPLDGPGDIAVDGLGNVYVVGGSSVFKITPGGVITQIIDANGDGAGNELYSPSGVAVDGSGNVYVTGRSLFASASDNAFKITPGGVITEIIDPTGDGAGNPLDGTRPSSGVRRS